MLRGVGSVDGMMCVLSMWWVEWVHGEARPGRRAVCGALVVGWGVWMWCEYCVTVDGMSCFWGRIWCFFGGGFLMVRVERLREGKLVAILRVACARVFRAF